MTVSEWRRKHKRCAWCKHRKRHAISNSMTAFSYYTCKAKGKEVNTRLPRLFCKVFELEEDHGNL